MKNYIKYYQLLQINCKQLGFHGVMVSTQDSESCDPSSNLGGTCLSTFLEFLIF
jgi:hypothetical protein